MRLGVILIGILLAGVAGVAKARDGGVPITVVNYSKLPVYATAVAVDAAELCGKLGVREGSPLSVRRADRAEAIPLTRGMEDGHAVIRLYVALAPLSRLDLVAESAAQWREAKPARAVCEPASGTGAIGNGILGVTFDRKGWNLGFISAAPESENAAAADKNLLVENGQLDFWIDNQNRGRLLNGNPSDMGLIHYATQSRLEQCEAAVGPEGRPRLRLVRRMEGLAQAMTVTETFELLPGLPVMTCRVEWHNDGAAPLWVAYVSSGDGIKGKWSKGLMPTPLIERKKTAIEGDLNGGETRPAWLPQFCRISMESPATGCGFGMSTLLPTPKQVGAGSMVWGCGASGFQCNFIDPVQGQFPFLVKPHTTLENGFAFVATQTGTSIFRQTVALWSTIQAGKTPKLAPPCAVYVGGVPCEAQSFSEWGDAAAALKLLEPRGEVRQAALRLDFNKYYQCRVNVKAASAQEAVEITARPLDAHTKPVTLLRADKAGEYTIELNKLLNWKDEVPLALEVKARGAAALKGLAVAETLPLAPEPLSPLPDASVTDLATMFRWKSIPMVVDYELQWARTADFASPNTKQFSKSDVYAWYLPADDELPAPGEWFWRVRGVKGSVRGEWSAPRRFTVNNEHPLKPLKRPLTSERPLFTLEATRVLDYTAFHPDVPADIAPYIGIIAEGFESKGLTVDQFARGMERLPHPIMLRSHWVSLADIEWLCQHVPNFIGIQGGEHLSDLYQDGKDGAMRYAHRLTRICAKYGCLYQEADGTYKDDKWQDLMDRQGAFVREYGRYLVLSQKNNIIRRQFYSQSAALGLWLGGLTHAHGAWEDGGFYWQNAGFKELGTCAGERSGILKTKPRMFWSLVCVMGISRGCGIYSLDGQTLMISPKEAERNPDGGWRSAIWDTTGKTTDCFKETVAPLIRGAVRHGLIPTQEEVRAKVRLAVYNDMKGTGDLKAWPHYVEYGPLYAATYGFRKMGNIDGQLWEFFPNTGRYYFIPVLVQGNEPLGGGIRNIPVSQLQDVASVNRLFDAAYPAWYEGDALVTRAGGTLTIQNSHENENVTESYRVPLDGRMVKNIAGKVSPNSYLVGKIEAQGKRFWFQANTEYPERDTEVSLTCAGKPKVRIEPAAAAKELAWDEGAKSLRLRLSHRQGAVEVSVE